MLKRSPRKDYICPGQIRFLSFVQTATRGPVGFFRKLDLESLEMSQRAEFHKEPRKIYDCGGIGAGVGISKLTRAWFPLSIIVINPGSFTFLIYSSLLFLSYFFAFFSFFIYYRPTRIFSSAFWMFDRVSGITYLMLIIGPVIYGLISMICRFGCISHWLLTWVIWWLGDD